MKAVICASIEVEFEDNGTDDLRDQAVEAFQMLMPSSLDISIDRTIVPGLCNCVGISHHPACPEWEMCL